MTQQLATPRRTGIILLVGVCPECGERVGVAQGRELVGEPVEHSG